MRAVEFNVTIPGYILARTLGRVSGAFVHGRASRLGLVERAPPRLPGDAPPVGMTEHPDSSHAAARASVTEWRWGRDAVGRAVRGATLIAGFSFSALLAGCDRPEPVDPAGTEAGFAVRDSAGIEIVDNYSPEHPPERFWRMDMEPEIVLGASDRWLAGDSAHLIWGVSGLARLEDGRVAVLSRGNRQLYLFEPTGELSRVMGGEGRGPGEFGGPDELQYLPPDTLAVWDSWFGPVGYFNTDGDLIRTRSVDLGKVMAGTTGVTAESRRIPLADGSFVTTADVEDRTLSPPVGTLIRSPLEFVLVDREHAVRSLGVWNGLEHVLVDIEFEDWPGPFPVYTLLDAFLAGGTDPPAVYFADGTRDEIRQFSLDGRLVRIIRRWTAPVPVSDEAHRAWATYLATRHGLEGREFEELLRTMPTREFLPPIAGLFVNSEGYLWVSEWSAPEVGGPDRWSVFSPEGRWLGVFPAPRLDVACNRYRNRCWMGTDFFLAVRLDELGRERVEGYRIRRQD